MIPKPAFILSVLSLMWALSNAAAPIYLRCDYRINPLGIDNPTPQLSWELDDTARGAAQTGYQILVASTSEKLAADQGDLWNSGQVALDQTAQIQYHGSTLASSQECFWKVRAWDQDKKATAWSAMGSWTMGLLNRWDWQAAWIGHSNPKVEVPHLRREFSVRKPIRSARIHAMALGLFELSLNGQRVGKDYFAAGLSEYSQRVYYRTYDVKNLIVNGANALGAIVAPGWWSARVAWFPEPEGRSPRLRAQLEIQYEDGSRETIATDGSWKASDGPIVSVPIQDGELYDARKEMPGWDRPGFADAGWETAVVSNETFPNYSAHPGEPVRTFDTMHPVKVTQPVPKTWIFDMGQEFSGWARIQVSGPAGTVITLRFGEALNPDGTLYTANLPRANCTDIYILKGTGTETWEPRFTYRGYRYVEMTGLPGAPGSEAVIGIAAKSDNTQVGTFSCSNPLINKLQSNIVWTQRSNFFEIPTDCPQRGERMGWTGDAQVFSSTAAYNQDVMAFYSKWLGDVWDAQFPSGGIPAYVPRFQSGEYEAGGPGWADAGLVVPWTLFQIYGDTAVLARSFPGMVRQVEWWRDNSEGLIRHPKAGTDWGDWLEFEPTDKSVFSTAYFAYSTNLLAKSARVLGRMNEAGKYDSLFLAIRDAFNRTFVAADGVIMGNTQTAYVLALAFDLLPAEKRGPALTQLEKSIALKKGMTTGFHGARYILPVLSQMGRKDLGYTLLLNETLPSWLFPIKNGATTIWERWDGWTPEKGFQNPAMNSFNHYAFGAVGDWLYRNVAGIDMDAPGFKKVVIRPQPGGNLTSAKATYHSIHGTIVSDWKLASGGMTLAVTIPANTSARVLIPARSLDQVLEGDRAARNSPGVAAVGYKDSTAEFQVAAGRYLFRTTEVVSIVKGNIVKPAASKLFKSGLRAGVSRAPARKAR